MTLRYAPILVLLFMLPAVSIAGPIDKIAELIKQGNTQELAKFFAANVDVSILENTNVYSKTQSEVILDKFFKENKPQAVKILHRVNSNTNYNFAVLILTTDKGKFRIAVTLKEIGGTMALIEIRIEAEKT